MTAVTGVEVSGTKVHRALMVFKDATGLSWLEAKKVFSRFVDGGQYNKHRYFLSAEEAARVEGILGVYGHAYCKMLLINESS